LFGRGLRCAWVFRMHFHEILIRPQPGPKFVLNLAVAGSGKAAPAAESTRGADANSLYFMRRRPEC
jgi:hypothetical protein